MEYGEVFYKFNKDEGADSISKRIYLCENLITKEKIFVNGMGCVCNEVDDDLYKTQEEIEKIVLENLKSNLKNRFNLINK